MKINNFADFAQEQIDAFTNGNRDEPLDLSTYSVRPKDVVNITPADVQTGPPTKDWRPLGVVAPVKDQGFTCNSCWAFSVSFLSFSLN